jgi:hypothetical protein
MVTIVSQKKSTSPFGGGRAQRGWGQGLTLPDSLRSPPLPKGGENYTGVTCTLIQFIRPAHGYASGKVTPVDPVFGIRRELPARVDILESREKPPPVPGRELDSFEPGWAEPYLIYGPNGRA